MMLWMIADKYGKKSNLAIPSDGSQYEILQWLFYGADELEQGHLDCGQTQVCTSKRKAYC